jgi:hypothetical protein
MPSEEEEYLDNNLNMKIIALVKASEFVTRTYTIDCGLGN